MESFPVCEQHRALTGFVHRLKLRGHLCAKLLGQDVQVLGVLLLQHPLHREAQHIVLFLLQL
jgi:hypothetical protein